MDNMYRSRFESSLLWEITADASTDKSASYITGDLLDAEAAPKNGSSPLHIRLLACIV